LGDGLTAVYIIIGEEWHYKKGRTARKAKYTVGVRYSVDGSSRYGGGLESSREF
jgi:hypothetical protein